MITINETHLTKATQTLLNKISLNKNIPIETLSEQLLIWLTGELLKTKIILEASFTETELKELKQLSANAPINDTTTSPANDKLKTISSIGRLYLTLSTTEEETRMISANEYAKRTRPRLTRERVCQLARQGKIPGAKKITQGGRTLWQIPANTKEA